MKTIPFSIRFTETMHSLVQSLSKTSGKSPTDVIETALRYQRLDFRMNYLELQKKARFTCLNMIQKWQKKEFISPEEYAFLVGECHRKYIKRGTVGVAQVEALIEITKEIELHLDAKKITYQKEHINKYLQEGYLNSLKEQRSASAADSLTRPIEYLADYFDEIDAVTLHKLFTPYLGLLLPLALFESTNLDEDEDCYKKNEEEKTAFEVSRRNRGIKSISVNLGEMKFTINSFEYLLIESKSFLFPINAHSMLFFFDVLKNWVPMGEDDVEFSFDGIKIVRFIDSRFSEVPPITIQYHGLRFYFTEEQFQKIKALIEENLNGEWLEYINRYQLNVGSIW